MKKTGDRTLGKERPEAKGRVLARVFAEELKSASGEQNTDPSRDWIILPTGTIEDATISEAATSESIPDH
jgi:hypothetical protein